MLTAALTPTLILQHQQSIRNGLVVLVVEFGQVIPHLKALGLLIFIIAVLDQFHGVAS